MLSIHPYLNFSGNTEEAFNFYQSVFGGTFTALQRFGDTPEAGRVPADDLDKIMHIALTLGSGVVLMGTDALESMGHHIYGGTNFHLSVNTGSEAEATQVFEQLSKGGKITIPLAKMFWGALFGMLTDRFGIQWMVNYDLPAES